MESNNNHENHIDEASDDEEQHRHNENLQCRFYRKDFPEENDLVIVYIHLYF